MDRKRRISIGLDGQNDDYKWIGQTEEFFQGCCAET